MPVLKNQRHEAFAQGLAKGMSAVGAYEAAGFKRNWGNAGRLHRSAPIVARVAEIQGRAAAKVELTKADILQMLIDDRKLARENDQASAAIRAAELLGKEIGMFVDRKDVRVRRLDDLSEDELDGLLAELDAEPEGSASARRPH